MGCCRGVDLAALGRDRRPVGAGLQGLCRSAAGRSRESLARWRPRRRLMTANGKLGTTCFDLLIEGEGVSCRVQRPKVVRVIPGGHNPIFPVLVQADTCELYSIVQLPKGIRWFPLHRE